MTTESETAMAVIDAALTALADGGGDFCAVFAPGATSTLQEAAPSWARQCGPHGMRAIAGWLASGFDDLRWQVDDLLAVKGAVMVRATLSGRHVRAFFTYDETGRAKVHPPSGYSFAVPQVHWFTVTGGLVAAHHMSSATLSAARLALAGPSVPNS